MNSRLTLDYGLRFVNQQPQYDIRLQSSNFFPNQWSAAAAPGSTCRAAGQRQSVHGQRPAGVEPA